MIYHILALIKTIMLKFQLKEKILNLQLNTFETEHPNFFWKEDPERGYGKMITILRQSKFMLLSNHFQVIMINVNFIALKIRRGKMFLWQL